MIGAAADRVDQFQAFVAGRSVSIEIHVCEDEVRRLPVEFREQLFRGGGHAGAIAAVFKQKVQGNEDIGLVITNKHHDAGMNARRRPKVNLLIRLDHDDAGCWTHGTPVSDIGHFVCSRSVHINVRYARTDPAQDAVRNRSRQPGNLLRVDPRVAHFAE